MKVVHFSTRDFGGGAAKASLVLHQQFLQVDVEHTLIVLEKHTDDSTIMEAEQGMFARKRSRLMMELNSVFLNRIYHPWEMCSLGIARDLKVEQYEAVKQADVIGLSWVSAFLSTEAVGKILDMGKPVVWTLYDMWPITGACHYAEFCDKFQTECGKCHQIGKGLPVDVVKSAWQKKKALWNVQNLTVVCPSQWLASCVTSSALMHSVDVLVIPIGVDVTLFQPTDVKAAREHFSLPQGKKLISFLANSGFENERKGGPLLQQALLKLVDKMQELPDLVLVGCKKMPDELQKHYHVHCPQIKSEQDLALLYASCDTVAIPSKEENLALTLLESMACGTPCVTFDIGGMPDVITHLKSGYMAKAFDVDDYVDGIKWVLGDEPKAMLATNCRQSILDGFTIEQEASAYRALYEEKIE